MEVDTQALTVVEPGTSTGSALFGGVVVDDTPLWMAWEGARRAWLDSKQRRSQGPNTVKAYETAFRQFFEWCALPPWQVSSGVAVEWTAHLEQERGLAQSSIALKLAALSSFFDFVQRRYTFRTPDGREVVLLPADQRNPFGAVERPQISPYGRASYPSVEEAQAILAIIDTHYLTGKRDFAFLFTVLVTCRRSSEILNMKWGDLRELEDGDYAFSYRYKGGKTKTAVLNRRCFQAICAYLAADGRPPEEMTDEDYIWIPMDPERVRRLPQHRDRPVEANRPISNSMANKILRKHAGRAGVDLEKAHIHGLRHAGARLRVEQMKRGGRGVDYAEIMDLLGHSSLAVTQIYSTTVLEDPEDPGGEAAAAALLPKGRRRRRKAAPDAEQGKLL